MQSGISQIIRDNVEAVVRASGLSSREVAERVGCSERHVNRVRLGRSPAGRRFAEGFAKAFRIPVWQLYRPIGYGTSLQREVSQTRPALAEVFVPAASPNGGPLGIPASPAGIFFHVSGISPDAFGIVAVPPMETCGLVPKGAVLVLDPSDTPGPRRLSLLCEQNLLVLGFSLSESGRAVFESPFRRYGALAVGQEGQGPGAKQRVFVVSHVLMESSCVV